MDLSTNIQRAMVAIRGVSGGVAALMAVGLTILALGLLPLVWYFDVSATYDYADPLIQQIAPTLPERTVAYIAFIAVTLTALPTIIELLLPRIGATVPSVAFLVFFFTAIDGVTDWPRVKTTMQAYYPAFAEWGVAGIGLWYMVHVPFLLFATLLLELVLVLCVVLVLVLLAKVVWNEEKLKAAAEPKGI
jgi:hypothetical protein